MRMRTLLSLVIAVFSLSLAFPLRQAHAEDLALNNLVISELQTGGCAQYDSVNATCVGENGSMEFIELYNPLTIELNVENWKVQYISASGNTVTTLSSLDGNVLPQSHLLLSHQGYLEEFSDLTFSSSLAKTGGHIRIVDEQAQVVDLIGWGSARATGACPKVSEILTGYSVKRILPGDPLEGTGVIYTPSTLPLTPQGGGYVKSEKESPSSGENEDGDENSTAEIDSDCDGVVISEVLPNPDGSDDGREFIELHNPTDKSISLENCKLQTSSKNTFFIFDTQNLKAGEYKAFYDTDTSLNLANASGGTVWLLDHQDVELDEVVYPENMNDDVSYAKFDSGWKSTYTPTPNEKNILQAVKPCPPGQFRNLETNRCNKSLVASALKPCRPDQIRNPETNRCRLISSLSSALKPCDADQFRNPETNRCKKINSGSTLKPCSPGQERNPETNRCRKVSGDLSTSLNKVKDVPAESVSNKMSWWFAGASMVSAVGYAGFEWRKEFFAVLGSLRSKLGGSATG